MWCDNCLLLLPLRGGAMIWGVIIAAYSIAGGLFLLIDGQFLFFDFDEWYIYGGIGLAVAAVALINVLALSNRSYIWTRVCKFLWPFLIILCAVRAIFMIVQLTRGKDKIGWECSNDGKQWRDPDVELTQAEEESDAVIPPIFCKTGYAGIYATFIGGLVIDLGFQMYMFFMCWRYQKRLEHYSSMKGPFQGGYYNA